MKISRRELHALSTPVVAVAARRQQLQLLAQFGSLLVRQPALGNALLFGAALGFNHLTQRLAVRRGFRTRSGLRKASGFRPRLGIRRGGFGQQHGKHYQ
jgi:hypothetical protein